MSLFDRVAWIASWVAPLAWIGAALAFGFWVVAPSLRVITDPVNAAWAIGGLATLGVLSQVTLAAHGAVAPHFTRNERSDLRRRLRTGRGYGHWRRLMRSRQHWYGGRSHSGERPRYD